MIDRECARMKLYCDLYISECWIKKREKLINRLRSNRLLPHMYVITLPSGGRNNLEFYSGILLRQHVIKSSSLFVVGIADGYEECLSITEKITDEVYRATGDTDIRGFILDRQMQYEKAGQ